MKFKTRAILILCIACALQPGCSTPEATEEKITELAPLTELNESQQQQKAIAESAREKLFTALVGELTSSMTQSGPAKSIKVCKSRAPEIAAQVSEESGVKIGRTSFRLRNPENQPPHWAAPFVEKQIEDQVTLKLPDHTLAVLTPIRLMVACTLCHGTDDQVMPEVKAAIVSNYPEDRATGFSEGDIRGYFWVEVPANADTAQ